MKSVTLSKYFEIIHPQYVYLQLIPMKSFRNNESEKIISAVASTYRGIVSQIYRYDRKFFFTVTSKTSYYIYIEKKKVEFYFIVPRDTLTLIRDKIQDTWRGITLKDVGSLPVFGPEALRYCLTYRKEDALSLAADHRSNALLTSILGTLDIMETGDKIGLLYNFAGSDPCAWRSSYDNTINRIKKGMPIERQKIGVLYGLKLLTMLLDRLSGFFADIIVSFTGGGEKSETDAAEPLILTNETRRKRDARVVRTQIVAFSSSMDRKRQRNNAISIGEAFKSISGDNELTYRRIMQNDTITSTMFKGADVIKVSPAEASNFVALPGKELLELHKVIEHIDILESEVPEELQRGAVCIGTNTYRGKDIKAYLTTDPEYKHLSLVLIGPARAGKSELIANMGNDATKAGDCVIAFDYIGNCELSSKMASKIKNVLVIDCLDHKHMQGLGYNEASPEEPDSFLRYVNAKSQTTQLLTLINCINDVGSELSAKMERYLECAALVTFLCGGSINDAFLVLTNHKKRHEFIRKAPVEQAENTAEYIEGLKELDAFDKDNITVIGTRETLVTGIIDRKNRLTQNPYMEMMLKKSCKNNFNLIEEMQKCQLICIRMPESLFSTEKEKDIMSTYWMTKIWLALQIRKQKYEKRTSVHLIIDELYQVPFTQDLVRKKLSQMPKFSAKIIISCHYLNQIKIIRDELRSANSSYIIISGADKDNYNELKHELAPYEVEDVLSLKRYHALCLLKYEQGYAKFVVRLPKPL
jgi:hypothetical protein